MILSPSCISSSYAGVCGCCNRIWPLDTARTKADAEVEAHQADRLGVSGLQRKGGRGAVSYVLFPARHRGRPVNAPPGEKGPTMSLYGRNGSIRLNEAAVARLAGDSGRVVLWWDADRRRLAFSTATPLDGLNTTDKLSRCRNGAPSSPPGHCSARSDGTRCCPGATV